MRHVAILGLAGALFATGALAQPDPRAPAVLAAVHGQLGANGLSADAGYAIAFSDLNDDHHPEAIVHLDDRNMCGSGGCTTFVLTETETGWHVIGRMTASRLPIYRLPAYHNGWYDLGVFVSGGGIRPGVRAVTFAKGRYQSNPAKAPVVARLPQEATLVLPPDSEFFAVVAH